MVTTAINNNTAQPKRHYWITDAALSNWREKVKNFPTMGDEKLATNIDDLVFKAIAAGKVEAIMDGDEDAKLVRLVIEVSDIFFALLKKSSNPANGDFAVVTIMTQAQVDKKMEKQQWTRPGFGLNQDIKKVLASVKPTEPKIEMKQMQAPEQQPVGGEKPNTYMISYMPFKKVGEHNARVQEEYTTLEEVYSRIDEIKIVPGTLRAYKQLPIGYRIIDE